MYGIRKGMFQYKMDAGLGYHLLMNCGSLVGFNRILFESQEGN
jgi:hypothetical protein